MLMMSFLVFSQLLFKTCNKKKLAWWLEDMGLFLNGKNTFYEQTQQVYLPQESKIHIFAVQYPLHVHVCVIIIVIIKTSHSQSQSLTWSD